MNNKRKLSLAMVVAVAVSLQAQELRPSPSMYLQALPKVEKSLSFSATAEGKQYQPEWGLDLAWMNESNLLKGLNHMGAANVSFGRSSYRVCAPLTGDTALVKAQWQGLRDRNTLFDKVSTTLPLILNCDNGYEPSTTEGTNIDAYYTVNKRAIVNHWAAMINAHVAWMKRNSKHPVIGVSVMNEPDLNGNKGELIQGTAADIRDISKMLKQDYSDNFQNLFITGCNTLNDDQALPWYEEAKDYLDWGNTHQLAGTFANYAAFYERLVQDGKVGFNDEMHNVAEAFIGLEYGMTKGIWWGFDSRARGEFCNISRQGSRLAYAENRSKWTAACVYRNDKTGVVKGFVGGSERQASTSTYQFVSLDDVVYYDGQGPFREFSMELASGDPGTYMTDLHTNGERVIDITSGDDVAPSYINGEYIIMNKYSRQVVSASGSAGGNTNIQLEPYAKNAYQRWNITPVSNRVGGDFSFHDVVSKSNGLRMNVLNNSKSAGENVIAFNANGASNEQWYLVYAGKGYYYLRNRESALYLTAAERSTSPYVNIQQSGLLSTSTQRDRQMWRIIPVDAACETTAPKAPQGLTATAQAASVVLKWTENTETDLDGYMILRADAESQKWNTIARKVKGTRFVDNTCQQGKTYLYKIKAIDYSENLSSLSDEVTATPSGEHGMIARWHFDGDAYDATVNMMDAAIGGTASYVTDHQSGEKALSLNGSNSYVQLPYEVANSDELTFAAWVKWQGTNNTWQRIFDFGYDTDHYIFLTPNAGSTMRLGIKNGGDEQQVNTSSKLASYSWKHVAVTMGKDKVTIYIDGEEAGSSTGITIRPSDIHPVLNYVGRSQFYSDQFFKGLIDDMRIYNYALSQDEVKAVMSDVINAIDLQKTDDVTPSSIYGIDGRRYASPKRGLNIIDGKKVIR